MVFRRWILIWRMIFDLGMCTDVEIEDLLERYRKRNKALLLLQRRCVLLEEENVVLRRQLHELRNRSFWSRVFNRRI